MFYLIGLDFLLYYYILTINLHIATPNASKKAMKRIQESINTYFDIHLYSSESINFLKIIKIDINELLL